MATRKLRISENTGRKRASVARNRNSLLKASQEVLGGIGPEASIEQFSHAAGVSVSTIYKHFGSKESLIETAFLDAFTDWLNWVDPMLTGIKDPLEELVLPIRFLLRIKTTHPLIAQMASRNLAELPKYLPLLTSGFSQHIEELINQGVLQIDNKELRIKSIGAIAIMALGEELLNARAKESEIDNVVEVILGILNINPSTAKKLAHQPMPKMK